MDNPRISLEQWRALVAVVEAGGYAQAAEALNKSQSTISYAVHKLETLLDIDALVVKGRKAELTPAGRSLYRRGKALLAEASRLERAAAQMARGWEAELGIAAEIIFPTWLLLECLATLSNEHPEMRIQLHESVLGGTAELLTSGRVNLAIASSIPGGFVGDPLMPVRFIAAASPAHPLHQLGRTLTADGPAPSSPPDRARQRHPANRGCRATRHRPALDSQCQGNLDSSGLHGAGVCLVCRRHHSQRT